MVDTYFDATFGGNGIRRLLLCNAGVGQPGGQVAAISRFTEHIDVFAVGTDGLIYSTWWDGATGWAGWFPLGVT